MNFTPLKYIYRPSGNPDAYTLLLLHGTGGNETDLLPIAQQFGRAYNVLSVRGNVLEQGMPRFFRRIGMGVFDEQDLQFRTEELIAFLDEVSVKENFNRKKIIALGYSNGANIAGSVLVLHPDLLAGAILFRPMQPFKKIAPFTVDKPVPVFFSSGKMDPTVNPEDTERYVDLLTKGGFQVDFHHLDTSHNLTQEDIRLAITWLQLNFS